MISNQSLEQMKFLKQSRRHRWNVRLIQFLLLAFFFLLWEITAQVGLLNDFIFSSPLRMFTCVCDMAKDGSIFLHIGITLAETLLSFFITMILGIVIALILWMSRSISEILEPYLVMLNSLPKTALAPVLIVWLGNNMKTIVVAAVSVAVFGCIITLYTGFREMDPDQIKLIKTLGGHKKDIMTKVLLPGSIPLIVSSMKVNIGLCLVGVIIGEFLAADKGLGYLIIYGSQVFKMDWVMMSIIILCIIAACLYQLINMLEKHYGKKR